jgi:hypothetical protein
MPSAKSPESPKSPPRVGALAMSKGSQRRHRMPFTLNITREISR